MIFIQTSLSENKNMPIETEVLIVLELAQWV